MKSNIIAIYLAAGDSKRMGQDKLALPIGNQPLGSMALQQTLRSKVKRTIVVLKDENGDWLNRELFNPSYKHKWEMIKLSSLNKGQSYSLKAGLEKAMEYKADAILVILADQPLITTHMLNRLMDEFEVDSSVSLIASSYEGIITPPILLAKKLFSEVRNLSGDIGARKIIKSHLNTGRLIEFQQTECFRDIDNQKDYVWLLDYLSGKTKGGV